MRGVVASCLLETEDIGAGLEDEAELLLMVVAHLGAPMLEI